jgi:hypothetical protein
MRVREPPFPKGSFECTPGTSVASLVLSRQELNAVPCARVKPQNPNTFKYKQKHFMNYLPNVA